MAMLPQDLSRMGWPAAPTPNALPIGAASPSPLSDPMQVFAGLPPMPTSAPGAANALSKSQPKPFSGLPRGR